MLILYHTHCLPPYRAFAHSYKIQNGDDIWPKFTKINRRICEISRLETWIELTTGVQ